MPQPTSNQVHVNTPLTNMSLAFLQDMDGFVARKVFPVVPVQHQGDLYYTYDKKQWFRTDAQKRAPGAESAGSGYDLSTDNYFCHVYAIHKNVDDQVRSNQDPAINLDAEATEFVTRQMMLQQEVDWVAKYFSGGVWTGSTTGADIVPGTLWDSAGSTPIEDMRLQIRSVQKKTGKMPTKIVLGAEVWDILRDHPDFLERIKFTQTAVVATDLLARVLDIGEVLVASAVQDQNDEGLAEDLQFVHGKNVLITHSASSPGLMTASAGYTFAWRGFLGSNASAMRIKRFRLERNSADRVEGEAAYDHKLVAAELGAFLANVIS